MVLSDVEIWAEIGAGRLRIDPMPLANRIVGSSIDLLLHSEMVVLPDQPVTGISVDPSAIDVMDILSRYGTKEIISETTPLKLEPRRMVIGRTHETIIIPNHLAARVEGKSSLARLGLAVHLTAPTIHTGFNGRIFLEMYNAGPFTLELRPLMKICQLVVERLGTPAQQGYAGRFQGQT